MLTKSVHRLYIIISIYLRPRCWIGRTLVDLSKRTDFLLLLRYVSDGFDGNGIELLRCELLE